LLLLKQDSFGLNFFKEKNIFCFSFIFFILLNYNRFTSHFLVFFLLKWFIWNFCVEGVSKGVDYVLSDVSRNRIMFDLRGCIYVIFSSNFLLEWFIWNFYVEGVSKGVDYILFDVSRNRIVFDLCGCIRHCAVHASVTYLCRRCVGNTKMTPSLIVVILLSN